PWPSPPSSQGSRSTPAGTARRLVGPAGFGVLVLVARRSNGGAALVLTKSISPGAFQPISGPELAQTCSWRSPTDVPRHIRRKRRCTARPASSASATAAVLLVGTST